MVAVEARGYSPLRIWLRDELLVTGIGVSGHQATPVVRGVVELDGVSMEVLRPFQEANYMQTLADDNLDWKTAWEVTIRAAGAAAHTELRAIVEGVPVAVDRWRRLTMKIIEGRWLEDRYLVTNQLRSSTPVQWLASKTPNPWGLIKRGSLRPETALAKMQQHEFVALAIAGLLDFGKLLEHPDLLTTKERSELAAWSDERQSTAKPGGLAVAFWLSQKGLDGDAIADLLAWCEQIAAK